VVVKLLRNVGNPVRVILVPVVRDTLPAVSLINPATLGMVVTPTLQAGLGLTVYNLKQRLVTPLAER